MHPANSIRIPMFSHDDIYTLLSVKDNYGSFQMANSPNGDAVFVAVLVAQQGGQTHTYAIKIEDITKLQELDSLYQNDEDWDDFGSELQQKYSQEANGVNGTAAQYQKTFLNFINDLNLGVSLYEMEQSNVGTPNVEETWKKLTLNATSPNGIKKTPCN